MLKELIAKAQELCDLFNVKLNKLELEKQSVSSRKLENEKEAKRLVDKSVELEQREKKIKGIEDAQKLLVEADKKLQQAGMKEAAAQKLKDDLEAQYQDKMKVVQDLQDQWTVKNRKLEEALAALEKDKETYKKKIAEDFVKNAKISIG